MISESVHLRTAATQFAATASDMCRDSVAIWQVDLVYYSYQLNFRITTFSYIYTMLHNS